MQLQTTREVYNNFQPSRPPVTAPQRVDIGKSLLRVSGSNSGQFLWINKGKAGSLETAAEMARLVRSDTVRDEGLQDFAAKILISNGLDSHSPSDRILTAIFNFVQTIHYIHDPAGSFEAIQNARQTIFRKYGDCDDLSVLLATLLAEVGFQPRFVLARYNQNTPGYDHIYIDIVLPTGRVALDPSTRKHGMGWESDRAIERLVYPIFPAQSALGSPVTNAAQSGAAIGLSFVPVVGPILGALVGPIVGLFSRTEQRAEETSRDVWRDQVYQGMASIKQTVDSCQATPAQGTAAANLLIQSYFDACAKFTKKSVTASCHNYSTQADAFPARLTSIAAAGAGCQAAATPGATDSSGAPVASSPSGDITSAIGNLLSGSSNSDGSTGTVLGLPTLLVLGVGALLLFKAL